MFEHSIPIPTIRMRIRTALVAGLALLCPVVAVASPSGAELYSQQCAVCHQADAKGAAGDYPPLQNRIDKIAATEEGRHYLADLLTHGMSGQIDVAGVSYVGYMPAFKQLNDDQIAAILTWISSLGDSRPPPVVAAAEIAAARSRTLTAAAVAQERKSLDATHPLP